MGLWFCFYSRQFRCHHLPRVRSYDETSTMNTVAHMLIASAALSKREQPRRNWAVAAGALAPDLSMFVFFAWSRVQGWSGDETWNVQYWTEPWQSLGAISNSAILFGLLCALAIWRKQTLIALFAVAALSHIALDFPLHAEDAHRHFWPLSDWRFNSPVSYWDPNSNGLLGGLIEAICVGVALTFLWVRFAGWKWRAVFVVLGALQIAAFIAQLNWVG